MAKRNYSLRAEILKRALACIDRGVVTDFGRFMVLGDVSVAWTGEKEDPEEVHLLLEDDFTKTEESKARDELGEMLSQLGADYDRADSDQAAKERTSLFNPDGPTGGGTFQEQFEAAVEKLSPKAKELLRKLEEKLEEKERLQEKPEVPADHQEGSATAKLSYFLDQYYSRKVLEKLEKIVRRASLLDPVKTDKMPSESVAKYFEEAHQCFLYGFPIATAVLLISVL